jgi:hypothetical protein
MINASDMLFKQMSFSLKGAHIYASPRTTVKNVETYVAGAGTSTKKGRRLFRKFALNSIVPATGMKDPSRICDCADKEPKD